MKKQVEISTVVSDLCNLFGINENNNLSFHFSDKDGDRFVINKGQFERLQVLDMLQDYFSDKVVKGGYCKVGDITLVFTDFEILKGKPEIIYYEDN